MDRPAAFVLCSAPMVARVGVVGLVSMALGCAATAPSAVVVAPSVTSASAAAPARTGRPNDPPGTRRVGVGEWSIAIGEDWQRRESDHGASYVLDLGDAGTVAVTVSSEPRPRGPAAEAYADMIADLSAQYSELGFVVRGTREVMVNERPARDVEVVPQYAGRTVAQAMRAQVEGDAVAVVTCTAPVEDVAALRAECARIAATLRGATPVTPPAGMRVVRRGAASIALPEDWVDGPVVGEGQPASFRSNRRPDGITVELDTATLEGTAAEYFTEVLRPFREDESLVSQRPGAAPGRRWLDVEIAGPWVLAMTMAQRIALWGDHVYAVSCGEAAREVAAGRSRCRAVIDSFRFGTPST
jgi:hypothetical protein